MGPSAATNDSGPTPGAGDEEVLDLREVFARPWEGRGDVAYAWWLRWFPGPRCFRFRSEVRDVHGDAWTVVDTTTFPDGSTQVRRMRAHQRTPRLIDIAADDMPKGATLTVHARGFTFTPYVIRTPVIGPLRLPLRYADVVDLDVAKSEMIDRIELRLWRVRIATVTMRLRRSEELCPRAVVPDP